MQVSFDSNVTSFAVEHGGLRFSSYSHGFTLLTASAAGLSFSLLSKEGETLYSYALHQPRESFFYAADDASEREGGRFMVAGLLLGIMLFTGLVTYLCARSSSMSRSAAALRLAEWKEKMMAPRVKAVTSNDRRGVFEVLYDSDDDEGEEEEIGSAPARQQLRADNEDDAGVIEIELHRV